METQNNTTLGSPAPSRATGGARVLVLLLLVTVASGAPAAGQAPPGALEARLVQVDGGGPVAGAHIRAGEAGPEALSDASGSFRFGELPAGVVTLWVRHIAYGTLSIDVEMVPGQVTRVLLELSPGVITLEPLEVTALSLGERQLRGMGVRRNVVTREQIGRAGAGNLTLGDVLGQLVPGVRVRGSGGIAGSLTCIELRSAPANPGRCLSPAVYLDGSPITNPLLLYAALPMEMIETIEVVPAAEAGARFGTGALYGALLLETRRPGREREGGGPPALPRTRFHDWSSESRGHPRVRSFAAAAAGNGLGLAAGVAIAGSCIGTVPPSHDRLTSTCEAWPTIGALAAALALPALGSGVGAVLGGRTGGSRGRLASAAIAATLGLAPGYALVLAGRRLDSDLLRGAGIGSLLLVPPFVSTVSDHQFRRVLEVR